MATTSSMFMYSLTLKAPTAIHQAIVGQFAGTKEQQILTASGSRLTLKQPDHIRDTITDIISHDCFGIIRSLASFRLAGSTKDLILVGSDSGRIALLEYIPAEQRFNRIHLETYGKSGVRRVIPGQYLATDPKGRACMVASVEKNKLVYILNRDSQAKVTISSPLEAHKNHALLFALVGLDVGYENPIFAALEVDYGDSDQDPSGEAYENIKKQLVYYELDLGLNHVVRKWADEVDRTAHLLFQVPGGADGPSGVLVCGEENITYRHSNQEAFRVPIPRRQGATEDPNRKRSIVAGTMHKMRGAFFFLLQTGDGDLFKLTIDMGEDAQGNATADVIRLKIKYFDTVPVATSLCILKRGFLFVAAESGSHTFYQFLKLGDDDEEAEFTSDDYEPDWRATYSPVRFHPRPLENLHLTETIESMSPLMGLKSVNLTGDDAPQLYSICGTGARSSFKTLRHGLEVTEIVESALPRVPTKVWTTKLMKASEYDNFIVLSFVHETLILSIGETVEEATDTGFLTSAPTIAVQQMGEDAMIQVHPKGIRHIESTGRWNDWPAPQHRSIVAAASNSTQVAIALSSGEIAYFEMDGEGALNQYDDMRQMTGTVTSLSLGPIPLGRQRSSFLAVGCDDSTVRILSLEPDTCLENKSIQALTSPPNSLSIMPMIDSSSGGSTLYLHIGLYSGVYIRTVLDEVTGELSDTRTRFLGPKPVKLTRVEVQGQTAVLALSTRPWLGYSDDMTKMFTLTPLDYPMLEFGWSFHSEQCPHGMVGIQDEHLRLFQIPKLSSSLLEESIPLQYTPRQFVRHPTLPLFYTIESDNNTLPPDQTSRLLADPSIVNGDAKVLPAKDFGYPRGTGHWASCVSVVDPINEKRVLSCLDLEDNEAAVSMAFVLFSSQDDAVHLVVGTGQNMIMSPRSSTCGWLHVYDIVDEGQSLKLIHKTKVDAPPQALLAFQGRLLAGIGQSLVMYDMGMRQLLRKSQCLNAVPNLLVGLETQGSRIICSDVQESVTFVVYKFADNRLIPFVDDSIARWTSATAMMDYETVAGGDKFGNLWLLRCPAKISEGADEQGSGAHLVHEKGYLQGTPNRLDLMIHIFTSDIPTSIQKTSLVAGGADTLLWGGLQGTIGILVPFVSREDVDFFQNLEGELRKEDAPLAGRDHLSYRSYYVPVKGVIDGDLCERYLVLPRGVKEQIAGGLDRSVREVERKIGDMRTRVAF
ncbi:hypothetical protein EJ08DRAFT_654729 [Tothia fuscella]|uniref:Pre-mRNA-splicing factor RSE1 n=1 Tax=Tothia fuscella TaxID=1048955 RepID=A0A9P4TRZ3_9PEZI|nr:hypothetical protein EJ08DRAFT_654729 [Tothia fuscella]